MPPVVEGGPLCASPLSHTGHAPGDDPIALNHESADGGQTLGASSVLEQRGKVANTLVRDHDYERKYGQKRRHQTWTDEICMNSG